MDPGTDTIPTGYLIWNVTSGQTKQRAGPYAWTVIGGGTGTSGREVLTADRTCYVSTAGSDSILAPRRQAARVPAGHRQLRDLGRELRPRHRHDPGPL